MTPTLSIIIVNYNSRSVLLDCLDSLLESRYCFPYEVFVVDNASSENINDLEEKYNQFRFIFNKNNLGFAAANNIGIKLAKGEFILLLNPDTIVNKDSFQPMINYLRNNPETGIVGCKIFNAEGGIERSTHSFPSLMKEFVHANEFLKALMSYDSFFGNLLKKKSRMKAFDSYWDHDSEREVDHVTGACMMVRREAIEKAGLLDEAFFLYNEEVEWSLRIKKAGFKSIFLPDSTIIHLFGHSTGQRVQKQKVNRLLVERYRGMLYFFGKHFGFLKQMLLRAIVFEGFALRLLFNYIKTLRPSLKNRTSVLEENKYYKQIIKLAFMRCYDWRKTE
ncbi:MAG: glycosyltransferase family 2 protein [Ignavibacteria bacterium]|jgi:GT2 family glycosyltransferase|nr:glycosyltransferase family 2 protein [Ignavibacteria bacterium]MCU7499594.1 glycosyltransferase family 2 protein [Ignavibacteria bacterium]MCU7513019.1 glycosyltransferase family 2 protein [Ignavibacteria bacterium]MCU7519296.1 glycosyltransferase family 2 protein [Ignavibacteria bacterium]